MRLKTEAYLQSNVFRLPDNRLVDILIGRINGFHINAFLVVMADHIRVFRHEVVGGLTVPQLG